MASKGVISKVSLDGASQLIAELERLPKNVKRRVLGKMVRAGGTVSLNKVRSNAPKGKTGLFKRSLDKNQKTYGSGAVVSMIGQQKRKKFSDKTRDRARGKKGGGISGKGFAPPIHLVNSATKSHRILGAKRGLIRRLFQLAWNRRNVARNKPIAFRVAGKRKPIFRQWANHPGTKGYGFMQTAAAAIGDSKRAMISKGSAELKIELASIARKGTARK